MQRDPALIPLSHHHHNALALCVAIERSFSPEHRPRWAAGDPELWQAKIERLFEQEVRYHFRAEEQILFPAAKVLPNLTPLVEELLREHRRLLELESEAAARRLTEPQLLEFSKLLASHVRKEERQLFEALQRLLPPEHLQRLGTELAAWFASSGMPPAACGLGQ
jgi:hemerythrin-like domain-containing protein